MAEYPISGVAPPVPTVAGLLADPSASFAVKAVARRWAARDCVDAAIDARVLFEVFEGAADRMIGGAS
ncbi:hypothetical protein [Brevundimonas sp.]|uniref:hypothetical protein n=1 Tax=Brevundimonas sp. TaxID=1871086 RepID=UPI003F719117